MFENLLGHYWNVIQEITNSLDIKIWFIIELTDYAKMDLTDENKETYIQFNKILDQYNFPRENRTIDLAHTWKNIYSYILEKTKKPNEAIVQMNQKRQKSIDPKTTEGIIHTTIKQYLEEYDGALFLDDFSALFGEIWGANEESTLPRYSKIFDEFDRYQNIKPYEKLQYQKK